jgi:hypothetical protein
MQDQFEDVQRLLRLKRYEQPGDDYFERFLDEFSQRQRAELLRRSSRSLLMDRLSTIWWEYGMGRWATATAGTACVALVAWVVWPGAQTGEQVVATDQAEDQSQVLQVAAVGGDESATGPSPVEGIEAVAVAHAGAEAVRTPIQVRLTEFTAVADPIEFIADASLDHMDLGPGFAPVIPPGMDLHARPLFESSRLRPASGTGAGNYIPLSEQ